MAYIIASGPTNDTKNIYEKIRSDMTSFIKNGDNMGRDACRLLIGEIQRDANKDTSDENIIKVLKQIRKQTLKNPQPDNFLLELIDTYLPQAVSDHEMLSYLIESGYTNDMIASMGKSAYKIIGDVKKFYGDREINVQALKNHIAELIGD